MVDAENSTGNGKQTGPAFTRLVVTVAAGLVLAVSGGGIGAWHRIGILEHQLAELTEDFVQFKKPGERFSRRDGTRLEADIAKNEADIDKCEVKVFELHRMFIEHDTWGRQQGQNQERRIERLESLVDGRKRTGVRATETHAGIGGAAGRAP